MNYLDYITIGALIVNTIALIIVIFQTHISEQGLIAARKSIEDSQKQRQIEMLPKFQWVIEVHVRLEHWMNDLSKRKTEIDSAIFSKDESTLRRASTTNITSPEDLRLNKFLYENMPIWLREIWMSGAQYYFDAIAPVSYISKDAETVNFEYAKSWSEERCAGSIRRIKELLEYLDETVPDVILNTPASITETRFLAD